jgi:hypothetical protein
LRAARILQRLKAIEKKLDDCENKVVLSLSCRLGPTGRLKYWKSTRDIRRGSECPRCFPHGWEEIDEDKLYEEQRQQEIDDGRMEARIREDAASAVDSS